MKSTQLALAALAVLASQSAFALRCGDVLYQSITLSGDVNCGPDEFGLYVAAGGVRINLNGFKIEGSAASVGATTGIASVGQSGTEIVGPGIIKGFTYAIALNDGGKHRVSGVTAIGSGVLLSNVSHSVVERSEMSHLSVGTAFGGMSYNNRIQGNDFHPVATLHPIQFQLPTIQLAGCRTEMNEVIDNRMAAPPPGLAPHYALMVWSDAKSNQVIANTFTRSVFLGHGAQDNTLRRNVITATDSSPFAGVEVQSGGGSCLAGQWVGAIHNFITDNQINNGAYGVALRSLPGARSTDNVIQYNVISRPRIAGLAFSVGSDWNNGQRNQVNAPVYAVDYGTGNFWP